MALMVCEVFERINELLFVSGSPYLISGSKAGHSPPNPMIPPMFEPGPNDELEARPLKYVASLPKDIQAAICDECCCFVGDGLCGVCKHGGEVGDIVTMLFLGMEVPMMPMEDSSRLQFVSAGYVPDFCRKACEADRSRE